MSVANRHSNSKRTTILSIFCFLFSFLLLHYATRSWWQHPPSPPCMILFSPFFRQSTKYFHRLLFANEPYRVRLYILFPTTKKKSLFSYRFPVFGLPVCSWSIMPSNRIFHNSKECRPPTPTTVYVATLSSSERSTLSAGGGSRNLQSPTSKKSSSTTTRSSQLPHQPALFDPPNILSEDLIRAHIHDFYDDLNSNVESKIPEIWDSFYEKYHSPNYTMIRPSGNPIHSKGFIDMFCSDDVKLIQFALVSVDSVVILANGRCAVATYTVDQRFLYKGTPNEDRVVLTCVLEEMDGDIKITFEQRTTGQPIPKRSRWDAL